MNDYAPSSLNPWSTLAKPGRYDLVPLDGGVDPITEYEYDSTLYM
jgi:hypothetical protein